MYYKTISFCYSQKDIRTILERKGYIVKSLSKVIDMIPELKKDKKTIFRRKNESTGDLYTYKTPPAFDTVWLAWKKYEEKEVLSAVLSLHKDYDNKKSGYTWYSSLQKKVIYPTAPIYKFMIEKILENIIREQVNVVINL